MGFDGSGDEDLAVLSAGGDQRAYEELFTRYKARLFNFIYRMIGNKETAEEVALEVFMKAFTALKDFNPAKSFSTWIYTIARNLSKNALRDRKYFRDMSLDETVSEGDNPVALKDVLKDPSPRPDVIAQDNELAEEAQRVIDALPVQSREVITLCSIQGMTCEEAGNVLGCSPATVSIRLHKAKDLFMKRLGIAEAGEGGDGRES